MTAPAGLRSRPVPRPLMRWLVNPLVRALVGSRAGRWTGPLLVLEMTGRRTGRSLRVPVLAHPHDGVLYVLTDAGWAANFRGGAPVTVVRHGRRVPGRGLLVEDPQEAAAALRAALAATGPRALGLVPAAGDPPSDDELNALRRAVSIHAPGLS